MTILNDRDPWIVFGVAIGLVLAVAAAYHLTLPPARPTVWYAHLVFFVTAGATFAIPTDVSAYVFTGLSVTLIGTVFPIYESLRAVCTPDEEDDKYWLQYYMAGGILFISTQFVDEWLKDDADNDSAVTYWYQCMFFLYLWLYFPKTDGAAIIYEWFTKPCLAPILEPAKRSLHHCFSYLYQLGINACHIVILVFFFTFFPDRLKKIIAVSVGTIYPLISSITAAATDDVADDTYWLTYWSCYSCLFLSMEVLEIWLGWIPGFYSFYIFCTVYLMLPMFNGADKVFRKVLVPLARLQDLLILRDAVMIKKRILADLDPEQAKAVKRAIVQYYDDDDAASTLDQQRALMGRDHIISSWKSVQVPGFSSLFRNRNTANKKMDDDVESKGNKEDEIAVPATQAETPKTAVESEVVSNEK